MAPKSERKRKQKENNSKRGELQLGMNVCAPMALRKARANSKVPLNLLEKLFVNPGLVIRPFFSCLLFGKDIIDSFEGKINYPSLERILFSLVPSSSLIHLGLRILKGFLRRL